MKKMNRALISFWKDEEGIGTLELILIIAVIVVLAIAFRKWIIHWISDLFTSTDNNIDQFNQVSNNGLDPSTASSSGP